MVKVLAYLIVYECNLLRYALHNQLVLKLQVVEGKHGVVVLVHISSLTVVLCIGQFN
jgi:hypothetical protein